MQTLLTNRRPLCSGCHADLVKYQKGEFFLCERCYRLAKGLYAKAEIEKALKGKIDE